EGVYSFQSELPDFIIRCHSTTSSLGLTRWRGGDGGSFASFKVHKFQLYISVALLPSSYKRGASSCPHCQLCFWPYHKTVSVALAYLDQYHQHHHSERY
ncbi:hypothetical protein V496_09972, partial [Pseudogymnoascus sp. VKM F-4515 (FW-2607)]